MNESNPTKASIRIPPPVIAVICAVSMWSMTKVASGFNADFTGQTIMAGLLIGAGLSLDVISIKGFWTARTTINPIHIERTSALVTDGLYKFSRNPMYLGLAFVLTGWALWLGNPINLIGVAAFVWLMNTLQIKPEEELLLRKFGEPYRAYQARVRRWI